MLSRQQVDAVVAADSSWRLPYRVASGEWGYPGFPLLSGARMTTPVRGFGTTAPAWPAYVGGPASEASSFRCER